MVNINLEVTTRDIARQILRHRSLVSRSQCYAMHHSLPSPEVELPGSQNRPTPIKTDDAATRTAGTCIKAMSIEENYA